MQEHYDKLYRLKPIIEGTPSLIERLKACFDFTHGNGGEPNEYLEKRLRSKIKQPFHVFSGFPTVTDPKTGEKEYFSLEIEEKKKNKYHKEVYRLHNGGFREGIRGGTMELSDLDFTTHLVGSLFWYVEDLFPSTKGQYPSIMALVFDFRYMQKGILREDYSKGGRFEVRPHLDKEGWDRLRVYDGDKLIREVCNDLTQQPCGGMYTINNAFTLLAPDTRIELR